MVGMGQALAQAFPAAREVFEEVDHSLNQHLSKLMFEGPESDLTLTANTQPAIMACSVAALRVMENELGVKVATDVNCVAGHSLGEYSALVAVGSLSLAEAARLLRIRGEAMQAAVPLGKGAMAAIIGLSIEQVEALCAKLTSDAAPCEVANHNSDQQIVISGEKTAVEAAMAHAKEAGAKRALALPVSAPFHCSLMQPAAVAMEAALAEAALADAAVDVIANVTAAPVREAALIRSQLVTQVTGRVRWQETMLALDARGITHYVELGQGKVLSGLMKRVATDVSIHQVGAPDDLDALANAA